MTFYDFCLAWNWEYDAGFVSLLEKTCARQNLTLLQVTPANVVGVVTALTNGDVCFHAFLDRASDTDPSFQPLADWARQSGILRINPQEQAHWAWDKATMHLEFLSAGIELPYTILLPPASHAPDLPPLDLYPLGERFVIKPAATGGGAGVILSASSLEEIAAARWQFPEEKYLLQAQVTPRLLDGRPAWFRVLVCDGAVYPCWWNQMTHVYTRVTAEEMAHFQLRGLREVPRRVAQVCRLHLFSTEIALTVDGRFVVVDYVNDPVDLRLQSQAVDGVPDVIVESIAARLARRVQSAVLHHSLPELCK